MSKSQQYKILYLSGLTLRQIGAKVGVSNVAILYQLRKLSGYRGMVSRILLQRVLQAHAFLSITRSRANQRRLKHCLAMLRKHRPAIYERMVERLKPKRCSGCSRPVQARRSAAMWIWSCEWCGKGGIERCLL